MLVLALGGGTVMTPGCAQIAKEQTLCIYLRASIETLMEHLENQTTNRPLLNKSERPAMRDRITNLMSQRSETYEKTAHIVVDTEGKAVEAVAYEILLKTGLQQSQPQ
jgi:shikimate kinase